MRAVAYSAPLPITDEQSLVDIDMPVPEPTGRDLLVEIKAVSVNPVDVKIRGHRPPRNGPQTVLGYDASGIVKATGPDATLFKPGDAVYYAGAINRQGTNSEFHLVDERIVGRKPKSLDFPAAAALPLTAITAYEALFDRLKVQDPVPGEHRSILIVGGAGGVGSIAIQIARALTDLTVIATASRPETKDWVKQLGAHHVIDHSEAMAPQVEALGIPAPGFAFITNDSGRHGGDVAALIAPQGRVALIDDPASFDIMPFKMKAVSIHWEMMFARPVFQTGDIEAQHRLLDQVADLVDAGAIRSTLTDVLGPINAATLKKAHALIETNKTRGKLVLAGF
ncbi:zinc-binding alcohol dehydrogenase family protein [Rhizobium sp. NRK18]|uniref:zinc-binding alcohol dehydrogenase family protein n=1 Tax=Rhizobium sp. NRK18 TaxID=2964667 RepID=UPI0021C34F38|nr:zinc-binding alcohol dehydrogenase family protein [Rhizobium sp. NRK18]MCQ2004844.1 zinc-binding alcohol dehydrogenase family protein [Rhizobium sp. NRK18]